MNIAISVPLIIYLVYHTFNVFMDCKYRITKNVWHLVFLIVGLGYIYTFQQYKEWYYPLVALFITLFMGLILEFFRQSSPGDTKMMAVSAVIVTAMLPNVSYLHIATGIVVFHLLLFVIYTYIFLFVKRGLIQTIKEQIMTIRTILIPGMPIDRTKIFDHFPGATTIMGGGLVYYIIMHMQIG